VTLLATLWGVFMHAANRLVTQFLSRRYYFSLCIVKRNVFVSVFFVATFSYVDTVVIGKLQLLLLVVLRCYSVGVEECFIRLSQCLLILVDYSTVCSISTCQVHIFRYCMHCGVFIFCIRHVLVDKFSNDLGPC